MMTTTAAASPLLCKAIGCVKPRRPGAEPPSPLPANAFNGFPGNAKFNAQDYSQSKAPRRWWILQLKIERRRRGKAVWPTFFFPSYPSSCTFTTTVPWWTLMSTWSLDWSPNVMAVLHTWPRAVRRQKRFRILRRFSCREIYVITKHFSFLDL